MLSTMFASYTNDNGIVIKTVATNALPNKARAQIAVPELSRTVNSVLYFYPHTPSLRGPSFGAFRMAMSMTTANWHWKSKGVTPWARSWFESELPTVIFTTD